MWAMGEPSGPMLNGTTYIVRPFMAPVYSRFISAHLGRVAPVVGGAGVLFALAADERAVLDAGDVARVAVRPVAVRPLGLVELGEGATVDELLARRSYSSALPSHQYTPSGCRMAAQSSTHCWSRLLVVVALILIVLLARRVRCDGPG